MPTDFDDFLQEVPTTITDDQNVVLTTLAIEVEVRVAFFMMHPKKFMGLME